MDDCGNDLHSWFPEDEPHLPHSLAGAAGSPLPPRCLLHFQSFYPLPAQLVCSNRCCNPQTEALKLSLLESVGADLSATGRPVNLKKSQEWGGDYSLTWLTSCCAETFHRSLSDLAFAASLCCQVVNWIPLC